MSVPMAVPGLAWSLVAVIIVLLQASSARAQGLRTEDSSYLGSSQRMQALQTTYSATMASADKLRAAWTTTLRASCGAGSTSLCGSAAYDNAAARDALLLATSPTAYDSRDVKLNGGFNPISAPADQGDCNACVSFSVAAAAEAAMATVLRKNAGGPLTPRLSPRDLYFCGSNSDEANCVYGWTFNKALAELSKRKTIDTWSCLPFVNIENVLLADLCKATCPAKQSSIPGTFSWTKLQPLITIGRVQQHIRAFGGVVTRVNLQKGFREWFKGENKTRVYQGGPDDPSTDQGHAVLVVGYSNQDNWGTNWADGGFGKVKFGILGMMDPADTFGISWYPADPSVAPPPPPLKPGPSSNCFVYETTPLDYVSKVAFTFGITVESLLNANAAAIPKMDDFLAEGTLLKICSPTRNVATAAKPPAAAAAAAAAAPADAAAATPAAKPAAPGAAAAAAPQGAGSASASTEGCSPYLGCVPDPPPAAAAPPAGSATGFLGKRHLRLQRLRRLLLLA